MKAYLRLVFLLTVICLVCTALLAAVHTLTREPIEQARLAREQAAIRKVLPPGVTNFSAIAVGGITNVVALDGAGQLVAAAIKGSSCAAPSSANGSPRSWCRPGATSPRG